METQNILHLALIIVLIAGTIFAWYNSAKEIGLISSQGACGISATMAGIPICVWGAIFFTIALVLALARWLVKS